LEFTIKAGIIILTTPSKSKAAVGERLYFDKEGMVSDIKLKIILNL